MAKPKVTIAQFKAMSEAARTGTKSIGMNELYTRFGFSSDNSKIFSQHEALKISTFLACVLDKAETVGQLPVKLYRQEGNKRVLEKGRRLNRIFAQNPCDYLDMSGFLEMMVASLETLGAFYAYPIYNDRNLISEIIPFRFQSNVVANMDQKGLVYYTYVTNDGRPNLNFYEQDLIIVRKMTLDGFTPIRPLTYYSSQLNIAKNVEDSYAETQRMGITSQMALTTEGTFSSDEAKKRLREDFDQIRGPNGRGFIPIFEQGLKPTSLKLTPQEAELFKNRSLTDEQICSMVGVPMHRIRPDVSSKADFNMLDEFYMRGKINPILVKFERVWNAITPPDITVEIDRKAFYKGSPWRLVEAVEREVKGGLASINEGRADLDREAVEGGDVFAVDNNNVVYSTWDKLGEVQEMIYNQRNQNNQEAVNDEN